MKWSVDKVWASYYILAVGSKCNWRFKDWVMELQSTQQPEMIGGHELSGLWPHWSVGRNWNVDENKHWRAQIILNWSAKSKSQPNKSPTHQKSPHFKIQGKASQQRCLHIDKATWQTRTKIKSRVLMRDSCNRKQKKNQTATEIRQGSTSTAGAIKEKTCLVANNGK